MFTRRVRNWEPSRVQLKKVIQSLKFSKLRQAWENPVLSVLQWVVLLQIINSDKQASSEGKIVSIASVLSQQKSEKWHNSPEQSRCYSFSLLLSFAMFLYKMVARSPPFSLTSFSCFCFSLCSYHDSWHESGALCHACSSFVTACFLAGLITFYMWGTIWPLDWSHACEKTHFFRLLKLKFLTIL